MYIDKVFNTIGYKPDEVELISQVPDETDKLNFHCVDGKIIHVSFPTKMDRDELWRELSENHLGSFFQFFGLFVSAEYVHTIKAENPVNGTPAIVFCFQKSKSMKVRFPSMEMLEKYHCVLLQILSRYQDSCATTFLTNKKQ